MVELCFSEVLICFSLIALWFNAFLVPLKLFITVVVPVTWTYGAAFYVYEDGALSWLGIQGAFWNDMTWHGMAWMDTITFFLAGNIFLVRK